jgi:predicted DNA-binding ArsR family transcriptional regulator
MKTSLNNDYKHYYFTVTYNIMFTATSLESAKDMVQQALPSQEELHEDLSEPTIKLDEMVVEQL